MGYQKMKIEEFFSAINTEQAAQDVIWRAKCGGKPFRCPHCASERGYQHKTRPEVKTCSNCDRQIRVRAGTIFESSKLPLLVWARALFIVMQGKRGISALELYRQLGMKSYGTTWLMLMKIRSALKQRDERYKLSSFIELDGAKFGKRKTGNQAGILVAIETRDWIDDQGRPKSKAGFAKVMIATEDKTSAQSFVDKEIKPGAMLNVDASMSFRTLKNVDVEWRQMNGNHAELTEWLPWVHRFISNAKAWAIGTHHGVQAKYVAHYLAEYTYRFNRRHDPDSLFSRALLACASAIPVRRPALCG